MFLPLGIFQNVTIIVHNLKNFKHNLYSIFPGSLDTFERSAHNNHTQLFLVDANLAYCYYPLQWLGSAHFGSAGLVQFIEGKLVDFFLTFANCSDRVADGGILIFLSTGR